MGSRVHMPMRLPKAGVAQPAPGPPATMVCFGQRQWPSHRITIGQPAGGVPEPLFLEVWPHRVVQAPTPTPELLTWRLEVPNVYGPFANMDMDGGEDPKLSAFSHDGETRSRQAIADCAEILKNRTFSGLPMSGVLDSGGKLSQIWEYATRS